MRFSLPILFIVILLNAGLLSAHKSHFEKNLKSIYKSEIVTESKNPFDNASICFPIVSNNVDMCCCSEEMCMGSANNQKKMSCKNHCEDLSNDINLTNLNSKNQSIYNLFARINILFIKADNRNTESSPKAKFQNTPTYISIHSFLI